MNPSPPEHTRLRVALVSTQEKWHGGESQAALLAAGLQARGIDCTLLARAGGAFAERMREQQFSVREFPSRGRSPRALWQLRQHLRLTRPHVVHANDAHALTAAGLAGCGLSIPLRVAARRVDFPLNSPLRYRLLADGLVCVSRPVADICHASGLASKRLPVVHDGVDPAFSARGSRARGRDSLDLQSEQILLLTVAKLTDHKGHTYLLKALPEIRRHFPHLVLAFAGDGELRESLEEEARQLGLNDAVRFLGYRQDVPDLLHAADAIVQPSHMEGLCSSLIDAMLAGKPIVASRAGGIPDLLHVDAGALPVGWLVPPKSPEALAHAILELLGDRHAASVRGQNARHRALHNFTADHMVDRTLQSYAALANVRYGNQAASRIPPLASWLAASGAAARAA